MADRLRYAMVGGGQDAFIGAIHRKAISLDSCADFVAGALSSTPERSIGSATSLGLPADRSYGTWQDLVEKERARPDRVDFVVIVTPNDTHYAIAHACLSAGLNVVCDKPFTITSDEAKQLNELATRKRLACAVTYTYSGYPMVRHARDLVHRGEIGTIRRVFVEYHQGWLSQNIERSGHKQASWRVDPKRAGIAGALGDIGTHAEHLARFITGCEPREVSAHLSSIVAGRALDDDACVQILSSNNVRVTLTASQVCTGEANGLSIRIYGDKAGLSWNQEAPETLTVLHADCARTIYTRGMGSLSSIAASATRTPPGHPEGYIEAFANIYRGVCDRIIELKNATEPGALSSAVPDARDGYLGIRFVEACVKSAREQSTWVSV